MEFWQRVHWFATSKCNQKCRFCFKPEFKFNDSPEVVRKSATELVDNDVKEVVLTGGEPTLLGSLNVGLEILADAGIHTSLHTNATALTPSKLRDISNLVDDIAIPIDSLERETQKYLRRADCLPKIKEVFGELQDKPVKIGIHTVATELNISHIPKIYDFLIKRRFDYWRIYEYNQDLIGDRLKSIARFREVQGLQGKGATSSDGGVNCLFAKFLLMEEHMSEYRDKRVQFIGVSDYDRAPYFFLDSVGDVHFCTWFLQGKRRYLGNILKEGFMNVRDRAIKADEQGPLFDEELFIETEQDQPLWVRAAWIGNYFSEELEELSPRYYKKFIHLSELYFNRLKRQGEVPQNAKLTIAA